MDPKHIPSVRTVYGVIERIDFYGGRQLIRLQTGEGLVLTYEPIPPRQVGDRLKCYELSNGTWITERL